MNNLIKYGCLVLTLFYAMLCGWSQSYELGAQYLVGDVAFTDVPVQGGELTIERTVKFMPKEIFRLHATIGAGYGEIRPRFSYDERERGTALALVRKSHTITIREFNAFAEAGVFTPQLSWGPFHFDVGLGLGIVHSTVEHPFESYVLINGDPSPTNQFVNSTHNLGYWFVKSRMRVAFSEKWGATFIYNSRHTLLHQGESKWEYERRVENQATNRSTGQGISPYIVNARFKDWVSGSIGLYFVLN